MTQEQLNKAKDLQIDIEHQKRELAKCDRYIEKLTHICFYGIVSRSGTIANEVIHPEESELEIMITLMQRRIKKRIAELEEEFSKL